MCTQLTKWKKKLIQKIRKFYYKYLKEKLERKLLLDSQKSQNIEYIYSCNFEKKDIVFFMKFNKLDFYQFYPCQGTGGAEKRNSSRAGHKIYVQR